VLFIADGLIELELQKASASELLEVMAGRGA